MVLSKSDFKGYALLVSRETTCVVRDMLCITTVTATLCHQQSSYGNISRSVLCMVGVTQIPIVIISEER